MPVSKRWIDFNEENFKEIPNTYGVYQLADENKEIVYIGEGKLKHNISTYLQKESNTTIAYFRYRENDSKRSSKQRQNILLKEYKEKHGEKPKLN